MHRNGSDSTDNRRKNDRILILVLLFVSGVFLLIRNGTGKSGNLIRVSVDQKEYGTYLLTENQTITIHGKDWENILEIKNGKASVIHADCPDKICVHHSPVSKKGETIVCLPHKVVIEVMGRGAQENEIDVITK